ncbi:hypothetical protein VitviT2T_013223 [Vitis vinifera]|uniref:Uncharacterized protein n=1 Tax=Vitis vinifera TaxID=29760 RepID=A0ABY9CH14_VITVI|nr:hypothetical protein VitviT2T_013223 [Vitis vinifera]
MMVSDTLDSKREHRRSSDNDAEDSSKRRKHRRHRHHHCPRHSSWKHEAEGGGKHEVEGDEEHAAEDFVALPSPQPAVIVVAVVSSSNWKPEYDVEEGEIVEEEGLELVVMQLRRRNLILMLSLARSKRWKFVMYLMFKIWMAVWQMVINRNFVQWPIVEGKLLEIRIQCKRIGRIMAWRLVQI